MLNLDRSKFLLILKRFKSFESHPKIDLDYLRSQLCKYNAPDYYETHLSKHTNISKLKRRASILIPISVRQELDANGHRIERTYFTLSKRTEKLSSHKGEVSFLGGKKEGDAESDVETAYREAREEANLSPSSLTFLAQLCPVITFAQILVTPVIAYFDKTNFQPVLNKDEVELIFDLPTDRFLKSDGHTSKVVSNSSGQYYIHYFKDIVDGRHIHTWGMTAFFAIVASSLLHARPPEFELILGKQIDIQNINKYLEQHLFLKLSVSETNRKI